MTPLLVPAAGLAIGTIGARGSVRRLVELPKMVITEKGKLLPSGLSTWMHVYGMHYATFPCTLNSDAPRQQQLAPRSTRWRLWSAR